jgi:hypothetical protein
VYAAPREATPARRKRGPKTAVTDGAVLAAIRGVSQATPFHGESYRKVRARLAHRGLAVSGKRVLRLMRQHQLLAPRRLGPPNGDPAHTGTIITTRPDEIGTDATRFYTEADGWCWFFGAIGHHTDELLGWHVAKLGDRWAALEPIRQGVRPAFGGFSKEVARGLKIRCDWGPQYIADVWINEVKWLGITISPPYVGEPECNGVIERFLRTLKGQCIYLHRFQSLTGLAATRSGESAPQSQRIGTRHQWRYGPACQRFLLPRLTEQSVLTQPLRTKASGVLVALSRTVRLLQRDPWSRRETSTGGRLWSWSACWRSVIRTILS